LLTSAAIAALIATVAAPSAFAADTPSPSPASSNVDQLSQELAKDQAQLAQLTSQVESAQGKLDLLNRRVEQDQAKQKQLSAELTRLARTEYELPGIGLTTVLQARSLDQLLTALAQARLVAAKQHDLLQQSTALKARDDAARAQAARDVAQLDTARDQAAKLASNAQTMLQNAKAQQAAQAAQAAQAQALARQAQAAASMSAPKVTLPVSSQSGGTNPNRFAPGNCTWYVASLVYVPWLGNAKDWWPNAAAYGYAEGQAPQVGAIMVTAESGYGHVALVTAVNGDGSWTVTEMNYQGLYVVDSRTIAPGTVPVIGFIYGAH
jgi:surface antigen